LVTIPNKIPLRWAKYKQVMKRVLLGGSFCKMFITFRMN